MLYCLCCSCHRSTYFAHITQVPCHVHVCPRKERWRESTMHKFSKSVAAFVLSLFLSLASSFSGFLSPPLSLSPSPSLSTYRLFTHILCASSSEIRIVSKCVEFRNMNVCSSVICMFATTIKWCTLHFSSHVDAYRGWRRKEMETRGYSGIIIRPTLFLFLTHSHSIQFFFLSLR